MNFTIILLFGAITVFIDLIIIHVFSDKTFKLTFVNKKPIVTIKTKYFFLPLTTKIKEYNDFQGAYVQEKISRKTNRQNNSRHVSTSIRYALILEFAYRRKITFFDNEMTNISLSKYRDEINDSLKTCQEYSISKNNPKYSKINKIFTTIMVLLISVIGSLVFSKIKLNDYSISTFIFIATILMLSLLLTLSLKMNNSKKNSQTLYNNENINIDSEADKINDSIIK